MRAFGFSIALLALAACDSQVTPPAEAPPANMSAEAKTVVAMPNGQRNGVLFRAIRDAGEDCQQVTATAREADVAGAPSWSVRCDDRHAYIVTIGQRGIAQVTLYTPRT